MSDVAQAPTRELGLRDLVLFNIAAVVSIRWLATAAHIGPGSLVLWAGAAIFFFVPLALAVAGLTARYPNAGGLYAWTGESFGEWHGFLCGWLYWVSNLFFFPNLLVAGIGMALFTFGAQHAGLAENRTFMMTASLVVLWVALLTNLVGMRVGKWTQNAGGLATMLAGAVVIGGGLYSIVRYGPVTPITPLALRPEWTWSSLNFWSQIAFAFGGLELGAILSREIREPGRTVRRAAWMSCAAIGGFYILGTLALLALLKPERISVVTGLAQAGDAMAVRLGAPWLTPVLAVLIAVGILGQLGAWVGGSARLAFQIGLDRYLPASFGKLHPKWGTPYVALLTQGVACTVFLAVMQMGETVRTGYQLLVDMTVISYFVPFLYLFATAWKHGQRWSAAAGLLVTAAGIGFSFVPPEGVSSVWVFEAKLVGSCVVLGGVARILFARGAARSGAV